ncbi:hypothetical protein [Paraburkholderia hayleyella]|uniref:hypothetical protein n=1 Tax=Paraburkholderia hayleyella TaxID=2152889 RepID=UPI0012925BCB|nr:hypothetical protein [Paraburkholderia hayleyella]
MTVRIFAATAFTATALVAATTLMTGCTAADKNAATCEQLMRRSLAQASPNKLVVSHAGAGIGGSRVVVEGGIEYLAFPPPVAASAAAGVSKAASAALAASTPRRLAQPVTRSLPAAVECTFNQAGLVSFRWLAPQKMVRTKEAADNEASD